MPLTPQYNYLATQVPPWMDIPSTIIDPLSVNPEVFAVVNEYINTGEVETGLAKHNRNTIRQEAVGRYGAGRGVLYGLDLVDDGGLDAHIEPGVAGIDGPIPVPADIDLGPYIVDNIDYIAIWLGQTAEPIVKNNDITVPLSAAVFLGAFTSSAGALTVLDYSGRQEAIRQISYRRTGDTHKPTDAPSSNVRFWHQTKSGLFYWNGVAYLTPGGELPTVPMVVPAGASYIIPSGRQLLVDQISVAGNGELIVETGGILRQI